MHEIRTLIGRAARSITLKQQITLKYLLLDIFPEKNRMFLAGLGYERQVPKLEQGFIYFIQ